MGTKKKILGFISIVVVLSLMMVGVRWLFFNVIKSGQMLDGLVELRAYTAAEKAEQPEPVKPTPTPAADTYLNMKVRQLKKGMTGNDVKTLQILLNGYNFACGSADGDFGTKTEYALKQFQTKYKLGADGIAGNGTWTKLLSK